VVSKPITKKIAVEVAINRSKMVAVRFGPMISPRSKNMPPRSPPGLDHRLDARHRSRGFVEMNRIKLALVAALLTTPALGNLQLIKSITYKIFAHRVPLSVP
jgi:hypothetical protein